MEKQAAQERLERLFAEHVKHFEVLDAVLEDFATKHLFVLEKNQLRSPCRLLKRMGNPTYIIGISQEGNWHKIQYRDDLPHTIVVAAYLADETKEYYYEIREEIAYFVHFSTIVENLEQYLAEAMRYVKKWNAAVVRQEGAQCRHPMAYWREQGGIKIQTVE